MANENPQGKDKLCAACAHWNLTVPDDESGDPRLGRGECRAFPPTIVTTSSAAEAFWAVVPGTDWCGQWAIRQVAP